MQIFRVKWFCVLHICLCQVMYYYVFTLLLWYYCILQCFTCGMQIVLSLKGNLQCYKTNIFTVWTFSAFVQERRL